MPTSLRLELFVADLDAFVDFYVRVLGFDLVDDRRRSGWPYAAVASGSARIGAAPAWEPVEAGLRRAPQGVEVVLEVADVVACHDRVQGAGWRVADELQARPWGLTDFRVHDPDGHYVRVTSSA